MYKAIVFIVFVVLVFGIMGCDPPDPNPPSLWGDAKPIIDDIAEKIENESDNVKCMTQCVKDASGLMNCAWVCSE